MMHLHAEHIIGRFCVAGINHTNARADMRGEFAIDEQAYLQLLDKARTDGIQSVFVVSTCNRTEIYGYAHHPVELAILLTGFVQGSLDTLVQHGYLYQGKPALHHLFRVACGLDSQIVGDYEIQGQLKQAYTVSLKKDMIGPIMDRTINFVFQASKKIRTTTALSSGTVSVSYAAIEWLQRSLNHSAKKILLVGSGKFGRNVCKNIRHYLPNSSLTISNRTEEAAIHFAEEIGSEHLPFSLLASTIQEFDVVLVCTNAMEPIIKRSFYSDADKPAVIIDLSVPANVEASVGQLANIRLVNVDEISSITQTTIARRMQEVPKAEVIITEYECQFEEWLQTYQHAHAIRHIKENLRQLSHTQKGCEMAADWNNIQSEAFAHDEHIRKTVNTLVWNLKTKKEKGCQFIEAYHHFLSREAAV
jgi:glutamyl-tRNA reductase